MNEASALCTNNSKCGCPSCVHERNVTKAQADYKWNGIMPVTEDTNERMFWAVTWKRTVEYVACRQTEPDGWIILKEHSAGSLARKIGLTLFDNEYDAQKALAKMLTIEKEKLEKWIAVVEDRAAFLLVTDVHKQAEEMRAKQA